MSKLVSLILVVMLLLGIAAPAWAAPSTSADEAASGEESISLRLIRPMGGCEDGSASNCDYG